MATIIGITNQKGGVGKTTTAVNLAACLAASGQKTLLIDLDPQANATSGLGIDKNGHNTTIYNMLISDAPVREGIVDTLVENLHLVPSTINLIGCEVELIGISSREFRLKAIVDSISDDYKYIIVDSPPSLSLLTINVLAAVRHVIIPVQCEYYALEGLSLLLDTIEKIRDQLNPRLNIMGVLMTMFDPRTNLSAQVVEEVQKHFRDKVFESIISRSVRLSEAPSFGKPIIMYAFRSSGSQSYIKLCQEVINASEKAGIRQRA